MKAARKHKLPRRYQLKKEAAWATKNGHPWIFRNQLSQAASVFQDGEWVALVGPDNEPLGFGLYQDTGAIAVRVFRLGEKPPNLDFFRSLIEKAIKRRENLRQYTTAYRIIHGENDGLPGVVAEVYNDTLVFQTYTASVDGVGRWAAGELQRRLGLKNVLWKRPSRRASSDKEESETRILRGHVAGFEKFREGKMEFSVDLISGQKTGTFLDLRALRKWTALQKLNGKRVLNLYSYTGSLGRCAEQAGASEIWQVDVAKGALDFAKKHNAKDPAKYRYLCEDIFEWLPHLGDREQFDLVIVDPPNMAAATAQVPGALRAYKKLYQHSRLHVKPGGLLVGACCTSRIARWEFERVVGQTLGPQFKLIKSLAPEDDHPVGFKEGDYLKILIFQRER